MPPSPSFPRSIRRCLALLAIASAACAPGPAMARADSAQELVHLINAYRAQPGPCPGHKRAPAAPLAPHPALAAIRIARGTILEVELERAGFMAEHAEAIYIAGLEDAAAVALLAQQNYCRTLLNARFTTVGVARRGADWQIVLAQPLRRPVLPTWPLAGQAVLAATNAARATPRTCGDQHFEAAPPLSWNPSLGEAALAHSGDMAANRYLSHRATNGEQAGDRATRAGYRWRRIGENIASGLDSPEDAVAGWLDSPGHCANLMNPVFTEMGAAYAVNAASRTGTIYWTQVFGAPR